MRLPRFVFAWLSLCCLEASADFWVSPDGSDRNPGTRAKPFATLVRARDAVRRRRKAGPPRGGVTVWLSAGTYVLKQPLEFGPQDSGRQGAPVTYRAAPEEDAWISGGVMVPLSAFRTTADPAVLRLLPKEARGRVMQVGLERIGVTDWIREMPDAMLGYRPPLPFVQVYCDGKRLPLARWPNEGFAKFVEIVDPGSGLRDPQARREKRLRPGVFKYAGDRPARWNVKRGVWLFGYWARAYISDVVRAGKIDTARHEITWKVPLPYGLDTWGAGRWYAFNLLEELDRPGEWYIDRAKGVLYLWPPAGARRVLVSRVKGPLVRCKGAEFITFRGLGFEGGRADGLLIEGGRSVRVVGCEIRNVNGNAVSLRGGLGHQVVGCDIHHVGAGGVDMRGGDRKTLAPANYLAYNNHIHHTSELKRNYAAPITMYGVGMRAAHNLIHHIPHIAVLYGGNDLAIEYNEIYWCLYETSEAGVFYTGRDWTYRGNVVQYNYVHHINDRVEGSPTGCNVAHLDDCVAGNTYRGNILFRVGRGISICGGPWNVADNNLFIDCMIGVSLSARGLSWWTWRRRPDGSVFAIDNRTGREGCVLLTRLFRVPWNRPPYTKYPGMADLLKMDPVGAPHGCRITRNISINGPVVQVSRGVKPEWVTVERNWNGPTDGDPGVVGPYKGDYRFKPNAPALARTGFEPIPFQKIGLVDDGTRRSWPVRPEPPPKGWKPAWLIRQEMEKKMPTGLPVVAVRRAAAKITVDGVIDPEEWTPGEKQTVAVNAFKPERLLWNALTGEKASLPSQARLVVDDEALYVAFDNPVEGLVLGHKWGRCDAVEIAISVVRGDEPGPILIWRGYADGHFETSDEAGAPRALCRRAQAGVRYAAKILGKNRWTAEFRIPFKAIGVEPKKRNPRMLFALSVRKARGDEWVTWKRARGYTWDVRHSGVLWFEPFGNVSFGGLVPSQGYILLYGLGSPATLMAPGRNCQAAGWRKPAGSGVAFHTGDLSSERWKEAAFCFIPKTDGKVLLLLMGRCEIDPTAHKHIPVWTYYDDVRVEGATLANGGFERLAADGSPWGWKASSGRPLVVTDPRVAAEGRRCVKCWHNGRWAQTLSVKAGRKVTVRVRLRGEAAGWK